MALSSGKLPTAARRSRILPAMSSLPTQPATAPSRSPDERRAALQQANAVRMERAQLKAALRRDEVSIGALIAEPPPCLASANVTEVLQALRGYGPARTAGLLARCEISPKKTFAGLSPRQRAALIAALEK
jgi:hypothetical protein